VRGGWDAERKEGAAELKTEEEEWELRIGLGLSSDGGLAEATWAGRGHMPLIGVPLAIQKQCSRWLLCAAD
jgi:hypothetical protein